MLIKSQQQHRLQLLLLLLLLLNSAAASSRGGSSQCYFDNGKVRYCEPPFGNKAGLGKVTATSTCGKPPINFCYRSDSRHVCDTCDARNPALARPASHLIDYRVSKTCWMSEKLSAHNPTVNLTFSFGKKFAVFYTALTNCLATPPDVMEVYKSVDHGDTWQLWHQFSKNCRRDYGKRPFSFSSVNPIGKTEVVCSDINSASRTKILNRIRLSFSTNFKRRSPGYDTDPILLNWMLATDIRFVLHRRPSENGSFDSTPFAFSNMDIGAKCFCNGHARRCIRNANGDSVCECAHGTEGVDCERCKPFFVDVPWQRATKVKAAACKSCNCNDHTQRCYFNASLYNYGAEPRSAGVCIGCLNNTAGRNCHYCMNGYHRNWRAKINSPYACTLCNCHPLGAINSKTCDRNTGKCTCRPRVIGEKCDRCENGHEQTNRTELPCVKIGTRYTYNRPHRPTATTAPTFMSYWSVSRNNRRDYWNMAYPTAATAPLRRPQNLKPTRNKKNGRKCQRNCKSRSMKLTARRFCKSDWVFTANVKSVKRRRHWTEVSIKIGEVFRCPGGRRRCTNNVTLQLWIKNRNWRCRCPKLKKRRQYIIATRDRQRRKQANSLLLNRRSIVRQVSQPQRAALRQLKSISCKGVKRRNRRKRNRNKRNRKKRNRNRRRRRRNRWKEKRDPARMIG